jgi:3-deoxy-manno-octulosonate cytidylyltransferase (CMP-KDO synthetase)
MTPQRAVIVIPARFASTRFPGKPLADIGGRPMIRHVWERCMSVPGIAGVFVATDDDRIAACVRGFGGVAIMTPADLASGTDRVAFVARTLDADIYANVQGDEPGIPPSLISATLAPVFGNPAIDIGTAATPITHAEDMGNPAIVKVVRAEDGRAMYFSRAPIPFPRVDAAAAPSAIGALRHVGLYVFRREALLLFSSLGESRLERIERLEQLRALEHGMHVHVELVEHESVAVDVPEDVERALDALRRGTPA